MINQKIKLINPKTFKIFEEEIKKDGIIIKPKYLSICKADLRYFNGFRPKEILNKKLPLVLIHEGVGKIVYSDNKNFKINDKVCLVPIQKYKSNLNDYNYDYLNTKFMSSSSDGFLQKYIKLTSENLIKIKELKPELATLEVGSIVMQSIKRLKKFNINNIKKMAIIGTGSIGLWSSLLYKQIFNCQIDIVGNNIQKLEQFDFIDNRFLFNEFDGKYDLIIEAVGYNSDIIFDRAINNLNNLGTLLVLGVNEKLIQFNMRKVMEKGVVIISSHRSVRDNFVECISLVEKHKFLQENLKKIVSKQFKINIDDISDIENIFEQCNHQFKTIIEV